jgi:Ni/Co efflux regulator RcnB
MRNLEITGVLRIGVALIALTAAVPALAAPPVMNDDSRVGAPPVIAPPAAPRPIIVAPRTAPSAAQSRPTPAPAQIMPPMPARVAAPVAPPVTKPTFAAEPPQARPMLPRPATQEPMRDARRAPDRGPGPAGAGYHRPEYGYQIPSEWTAPDYYISDFGSYGLSRPASGFGWSRYYDDAVLTDQWGRVYDWRDDVNWADHDERYAGGRGGYDRDERSYRDDRRDDDRPRDKRSRGKRYDYKGRWTGNWNGGPEQTYDGAWHGSVRPHWSGRSDNHGVSYGGGSYGSSYSYDGGGTTVTTVVIQSAAPVMTTREISYDVVSYVPIRKKIVRVWKPRPKPACVCGS